MSFNFYIGSDVKEYDRKFKELMKYFSGKIMQFERTKNVTRAKSFRYFINVLFKAMEHEKSKEVKV